MRSSNALWIIPIIEVILPFVVWLCAAVFGEPIRFPVSEIDTAIQIFPKLLSEYSKLSSIYSEETAKSYALSYTNSFLLGAIILLAGIIIDFLSKITSRTREKKNESHSFMDAPRSSKSNTYATRKILAKSGVLFVALVYFVFFLPIVYTPTPGIGIEKPMRGLYGAFIFAFPLLFTLLYFASIGVLNYLLFSESPSQAD